MTYSAVFDESGKWKDSKRVVFAGLVGDQGPLNGRFSAAWNRVVREAQIPGTETDEGWPFFHTAELVYYYKRCSQNSERERIEQLFRTAGKLIAEHFIEGWANSITVEEFAAQTQNTRVKYADPFYFAFEAGLERLAKSASLASNDTIQLICDDSEEYSDESLRCYRRLKRKNPDVSKRIKAICFIDDSSYAPLQAADLFAYCWRAKTSGETEGLWTQALEIVEERFSERGSFDITLPDVGSPR